MAQFLGDALCVLEAHRNDSETLARSVERMVDDEVHDAVDLRGRRVFAAVLAWLPLHELVADDVVGVDARERGQRSLVDVRVAERDEPFILAAVVPGQHALRYQTTERVED